ncbi:MAG: hypothetical protein LLG01_00715 [Planctomycetaceae bacterium]|nr:hypothetical protein [Planctomycetaceae bacterium]
MWRWLIPLLLCFLFCSPLLAFDIVPAVVGNDQYITGRVGLGDPNQGLAGPYVRWNDQDPDTLWGAGVFGSYDLSAQVREAVGTVLQVPQTWWDTLDKLGARTYIGAEVGVCDFTGEPQAESTPYWGGRLGPLVGEIGYTVFEGGHIRQASEIVAESGLMWRIGVGWTFRF